MSEPTTVTVVGAGSWGTAVADHLAARGLHTLVWAREPEVVAGINEEHRNPLFMSDVALDERLVATGDLAEALAFGDIVVSAVPTQFIRDTFRVVNPPRRARMMVSLSKGIEVDTLRTPTQIMAEVLAPKLATGVVVLSGPSFAREVAARHPTAVVAASRVADNARTIRDVFSSERFRVYSSDDVVSVELGGALKNVIAIAAGIADGLGFGTNTRAAIVTRGLAEITRLGVALGGRAVTFAGLSGMGDLVLTCTGDLSRNRSLGLQIGGGRALEEILGETREVAEGFKTSAGAHALAGDAGVDMPITEQVYLTLHEGKDPHRAVVDLMTRDLRDEHEPT